MRLLTPEEVAAVLEVPLADVEDARWRMPGVVTRVRDNSWHVELEALPEWRRLLTAERSPRHVVTVRDVPGGPVRDAYAR